MAALLYLAVLPLAGCSPLTKGAVGVARMADGRLVAVLFACEQEDAEVTVTALAPQRATPTLREEVLYEVVARVDLGATVLPLSEPAGVPWSMRSGRPVAAGETRQLQVSGWGDDEGVSFGRVRFMPGDLPVVAGAGAPNRLAILDGRPRSTASASVSQPAGPAPRPLRIVTHAEFVEQARAVCD